VLKITYTKSAIGYNERQKATIDSLGLKKLNSSVVRPDNHQIRGMIRSVKHLVTFEEVETEAAGGKQIEAE
jgi:large subunit ribosomal protein L30